MKILLFSEKLVYVKSNYKCLVILSTEQKNANEDDHRFPRYYFLVIVWLPVIIKNNHR